MIELSILRWKDHPELSRWALNFVASVLISERQREFWLREANVRQAEIGVVWAQIKHCKQLPEKARNRFSPEVSSGSMALLTLWFCPNETDFEPLASRTVREYTSVVLSHQVFGNVLQWPRTLTCMHILIKYLYKKYKNQRLLLGLEKWPSYHIKNGIFGFRRPLSLTALFLFNLLWTNPTLPLCWNCFLKPLMNYWFQNPVAFSWFSSKWTFYSLLTSGTLHPTFFPFSSGFSYSPETDSFPV